MFLTHPVYYVTIGHLQCEMHIIEYPIWCHQHIQCRWIFFIVKWCQQNRCGRLEKIYLCKKFLFFDALRDLVPFVKFKKREKTQKTAENRWKPATLLKVTLLHGFFFTFFKLYKWYQIVQGITYFAPIMILDFS